MNRRSPNAFTPITLLPAVLLIFFAAPLAAQEEYLATTINIFAVSGSRAAITADLAEWIEANGGYYTYRSETEIHLRVPPPRVAGVRARLETGDAEIVRYDPSTVDYRQGLSDAQAAITAREEALERVLRYLDSASVSATLAFERELRSLNEEIEQHTGHVRRMRNDIRYARVRVVLSSYEQTLPQSDWSSFPWINELGMYSFLEKSRVGGRYR
jgi:hypothetical protein